MTTKVYIAPVQTVARGRIEIWNFHFDNDPEILAQIMAIFNNGFESQCDSIEIALALLNE